ncbi:MAG: F0F1 ATP synthase subunit gamma [Gammaproteobacteria bacterium]|jgi:F-type H+-transporting ATPase subunit gamma|nr:F0F1 ATP synthase subunit gamma [Gammaproteobacteria bacterium]MCW8942890.1 F0F1 ATP synthase subunit gamma [Gammaproteobacteria bacterium]
MTRRRDIDKHRHSLDEIREIMSSMKNLSFMEIHKISNFLEVQHSVVRHIEMVAADFLSFYPETPTDTSGTSVDVYLLLGTERGFCGDFNHSLLRHFEAMPIAHDMEKLRIITVGHKLNTLLTDDTRITVSIDGASVAEEVGNVLNEIVTQLASIQESDGLLNLYVLYHDDAGQLINQQLLPPFRNLQDRNPGEMYTPVLNYEPREFLADLGYHYLFFVLYEIMYTSLMAESRQRMSHLEGAVQNMDEQSEELKRQSNVLRQEEIIEEIEVILLSEASLDQ